MLELRNATKLFRGISAVEGVSFSARAGEITGYLGPNGSGKSTTMKMITGLLDMTSGEILFDGEPIHRDLIAYKKRMGYVPEEPYLYAHRATPGDLRPGIHRDGVLPIELAPMAKAGILRRSVMLPPP